MSDPVTNFVNWYFQHGYPGNPLVAVGIVALLTVVAIVGLGWGFRRATKGE